jgi:hypothetical protein
MIVMPKDQTVNGKKIFFYGGVGRLEEVLKNLKVRDDLHRRVKVYAAERGEGLQELTERLLEAELGSGVSIVTGPMDELTAAQRRLVLGYIEVLKTQPKHPLARAIEALINELQQKTP